MPIGCCAANYEVYTYVMPILTGLLALAALGLNLGLIPALRKKKDAGPRFGGRFFLLHLCRGNGILYYPKICICEDGRRLPYE